MKKISIKKICEAALLIALEVVLNRFVSFKALGLKFGFSFFPMALCGMLLGPWWSAVCYAIGDLLGSLLFPFGAYFPGFTLSCALMGLIYGWLFYKKDKLSFWPEIIVSALLCCVVIGLGLNSLWMSILYTSKTLWGWVLYRLPQEAGLFILHLVLLPLMGRLKKAIHLTNS